MSAKELSRRSFLKKLGAGALGGAGAWLLQDQVGSAEASQKTDDPTWGVLIDLSRCVGCNACALACKESNDLPGVGVVPGALDSETYTFVETFEVERPDGSSVTRHVKRQCMHCLNAACVSACPAAAMYNSGEGPVVYRVDRCLGCRYCAVGCPFGVPRFDWDSPIAGNIRKCWLCYERLKEGLLPACVEACPTGALRFGMRSELLAQAHGQITTHSDIYVDHVYGEHEVGGTSMLYISDVPFEQLGFPTGLPDIAPPEQTEKVMSALPYVIVGMAGLMSGTAAYTHRRAADEHEE